MLRQHTTPLLLAIFAILLAAPHAHAQSPAAPLPTMDEVRDSLAHATPELNSFSAEWTGEWMTPRGSLTASLVGFDPERDPRAGTPIPAEDTITTSHGRSLRQGTSSREESRRGQGCYPPYDKMTEFTCAVRKDDCVIEYREVSGQAPSVTVNGYHDYPDSPTAASPALLDGCEVLRWDRFQDKPVLVVGKVISPPDSHDPDPTKTELYLDPAMHFITLREVHLHGTKTTTETDSAYENLEGFGPVCKKITRTSYGDDGATAAGRNTVTYTNMKANPAIDPTEFTLKVPAGTGVVSGIAAYRKAYALNHNHSASLYAGNRTWRTIAPETLDPATIADRLPTPWQDQPTPHGPLDFLFDPRTWRWFAAGITTIVTITFVFILSRRKPARTEV